MAGTVVSERDLRVLKSFARRIDPSDPGAHNNLGVLYYQKGLNDEAVESFTRALELDSKMLVAQRNLEIAYKQTGYYDRRVTELRERLRQQPDDRDARWELGRAYASLGQHDAALDEFTAIVHHNPADVAAVMQAGVVEKGRGNLERAAEWFRTARELDPRSSIVHFHLGEVLYNRGLNQEALDALHEAVALNPENADAHYLMAFVLGDMAQHEAARDASRRAIRLNPTFARAQTNLSLERQGGDPKSRQMDTVTDAVPQVAEGKALAHYNLGLAFRQKGYYAEALREYRLGLDQGEERQLLLQATAEVHLLKRDYAAALTLYDELTRDDPGSPKLWNERGVVLHQLGKWDDAIASFGRAIAADAAYGLARNNRAVTLAQTGRPDDAVEGFHDAARADTALVVPRLNLGLLLFQLRRFQLALQSYRHVLDLDPNQAAAWNGIGLVLNELGRTADARNAFARAVESDPRSSEAHYNLSFALSALGDYDGALRAVTLAQGLDPYYVPQKFRLAIDLQYEDPTISILPEISADVTTEVTGQQLQFDPKVLDDIFRELDKPARRSRAVAAPEDTYSLARDYLSKGLLELAAAEVNRALSRGADPVAGLLLTGDLFRRRGLHGEALERFRAALAQAPDRWEARLGAVRALLALERGPEGRAESEALLAERPDDLEVLLVAADVRRAARDPGGALDVLGRARTRAPQRADIQKRMGDVMRGMGDTDGARTAYDAALALDPRFTEGQVASGSLYEQRNQADPAEAAYRAALDLQALHPAASAGLARLLRLKGRASEAVNLLVDVVADDPSNADLLLALAQALLDDTRLPDALTVIDRLLAHAPNHLGALFTRGAVQARMKRYAEAVRAWDRVVQLDPDGPLAAQARRHARSAVDLQHIFRADEDAA
ncbi:MAG: tetratricopeptide repeat protein [Gemmatimonadales bacterium]